MDCKKAYALVETKSNALVETKSNAIGEIEKSRAISQEIENSIKMLKAGLEEAEEMYLCTEE